MEPFDVFYNDSPGVVAMGTIMATSLYEARALAFWRYGEHIRLVQPALGVEIFGSAARAVGWGRHIMRFFVVEGVFRRLPGNEGKMSISVRPDIGCVPDSRLINERQSDGRAP